MIGQPGKSVANWRIRSRRYYAVWFTDLLDGLGAFKADFDRRELLWRVSGIEPKPSLTPGRVGSGGADQSPGTFVVLHPEAPEGHASDGSLAAQPEQTRRRCAGLFL